MFSRVHFNFFNFNFLFSISSDKKSNSGIVWECKMNHFEFIFKTFSFYRKWERKTARNTANHPNLCRNCPFPQNFHTRKLGVITVFFVVEVRNCGGCFHSYFKTEDWNRYFCFFSAFVFVYNLLVLLRVACNKLIIRLL